MNWIRIRPIDTAPIYQGPLLVRRLRAHAAWQNRLPLQPQRLAYILSLKPGRAELTPTWIQLLRNHLQTIHYAQTSGACDAHEPIPCVIASPCAINAHHDLPPLQLEWPGTTTPVVQEVVERVWQQTPPPILPGELFDALI